MCSILKRKNQELETTRLDFLDESDNSIYKEGYKRKTSKSETP